MWLFFHLSVSVMADLALTENDVNYQKGKLPCFVANFWVEV